MSTAPQTTVRFGQSNPTGVAGSKSPTTLITTAILPGAVNRDCSLRVGPEELVSQRVKRSRARRRHRASSGLPFVGGCSVSPPAASPLTLIHRSAWWKVHSEKSGHLRGPGLIHVLGSLCTTTTCSPLLRRVSGLRSHPRDSRRAFYARYCIRTSENLPSETVWKIAEGISSTLLWRQEAADRDSFDPSWPLSEPRFGIHCEFPNSFSTHSGE